MGNQNDKAQDLDRNQNQQGNSQGGAGNQQGGTAGQQNDPNRRQQGGQQDRQVDDNQDDLGRDVNRPDQTGNDINKKSGM